MKKAKLIDGSLPPRVHRRRYRPNGVDRAQINFGLLQKNGRVLKLDDMYLSPILVDVEDGTRVMNRLQDNWDATDDFNKVNLPADRQPLEENEDE